MSKKYNWAILGTGKIAHTFATGLQRCETGVLHAVGSRTLDAAKKFGAEFNAPACYGSYEEAIADPKVE